MNDQIYSERDQSFGEVMQKWKTEVNTEKFWHWRNEATYFGENWIHIDGIERSNKVRSIKSQTNQIQTVEDIKHGSSEKK